MFSFSQATSWSEDHFTISSYENTVVRGVRSWSRNHFKVETLYSTFRLDMHLKLHVACTQVRKKLEVNFGGELYVQGIWFWDLVLIPKSNLGDYLYYDVVMIISFLPLGVLPAAGNLKIILFHQVPRSQHLRWQLYRIKDNYVMIIITFNPIWSGIFWTF